jgi:hypothetical protein
MGPSKPNNEERRRTPRYACGGEAKIICLPTEGLFLPGRVRNLSMGGCCLEAPAPLESNSRMEILLRVNSAIFRAVSRVRASRGRWALGMEFLQLSVGGQERLRELVDQLARLQSQMKRVTSARLEEQKEYLLREMEAEGLRRCLLSGNVRAALLPEKSENRSPDAPREERILDDGGEDRAVDIFI